MTYAPVTETNPPFTTPPTWPFPTTAERWETDYRIRLMEAAVIYMWTRGGQNGVTGCVAVGTTAPPHDGSTITSPEGYLWLNTATTPPLLYYWDITANQYLPVNATPVPTIPPTGFNTYTDNTGVIWVSRNGSAWKRATDALHSYMQLNANFATTNVATAIPWDTTQHDPYALYSSGSTGFVIPMAGMYRFTGQAAINYTLGNQYGNLYIYQNSTLITQTQTIGNPSGTNNIISQLLTVPILCATNDIIQCRISNGTGSAINTVGGVTFSQFTLDYLGTG